ncbi:unnamed protein product [Heligmosomoides polygyrus]|uniref:Uncharacterized protein n=1 Tax=Heligmosomoides polygyrus TaxID=6339 RepID=A0A3P7YED1_HELPZ|nr:unnamed protein product [Heligmosomoides polygyrus]
MPLVSDIKQYSCRLAGNVGRKRRLRDIPEAVAATLVDFLLDTIGSGSANLDKTVNELRAAQHTWWINLGCNDSQREQQFRHRQNLGDALAEVGQWSCVRGELDVRGAPRFKTAPPAALTAGTIQSSLEARGVRRKEHNIRRAIMAGFLHPTSTQFYASLLVGPGSTDLRVKAFRIRRGPDDASQEDQVRRHRSDRDEKTPPLHAAYDSGEELFLGTCDNRGVGGVSVVGNTHLAMNIDSYESLTTRIGRLRLKRCGPVPALTVFVAYAPISDYEDEEVEAFYVELEKFYKEDHTFYKVIVGDFMWSWKSSIRKITPSTR